MHPTCLALANGGGRQGAEARYEQVMFSISLQWIFFSVIPIFKREFVSGLTHCGTEFCLQWGSHASSLHFFLLHSQKKTAVPGLNMPDWQQGSSTASECSGKLAAHIHDFGFTSLPCGSAQVAGQWTRSLLHISPCSHRKGTAAAFCNPRPKMFVWNKDFYVLSQPGTLQV